MDRPKSVSLSGELHNVILAIDGARELAERLSESPFDEGTLPLSIVSTIIVVRERLRLLERAIRGVVDPSLVWCRDNDPIEALADDCDVLLRVWSDKRIVRRLRKDLKAAKRRLRAGKAQ